MPKHDDEPKTSDPPQRANVIKYQQPCKPFAKKKQKPSKTKAEDANDDSKKPTKPATYVPDTNFTLACLVCLCFNLPLGMVAMYMSLSAARAYRDNDPQKGESRTRLAIFISLFSIVSTVLLVMSMVLWVVVQTQSAREASYEDT